MYIANSSNVVRNYPCPQPSCGLSVAIANTLLHGNKLLDAYPYNFQCILGPMHHFEYQIM